MNYRSVHRALSRARGPAAHYFCTAPRCDRAAEEWALDTTRSAGRTQFDEGGRAYSEIASDYDPLCRRCHRLMDGNRYA